MDSPWAFRRRTRLTAILITVLFVSLITYLYITTYQPPNCFDNSKNQDEQGIDCGGSCSLMCQFQTEAMDIEWARLFEVTPGTWTAAAYIQNRNYNAYTNNARYRFTFYDSSGRVIGTREGTSFAGGESAFAIIESRITNENNTPYRVSFEWIGQPVYYRLNVRPDIAVEGYDMVPSAVGTEIRTVLRNKQPVPVRNAEVVFIAYDADENAIAASKTYVEYLGPRSSQQISFSWPEGFATKPSRVEFIPREPVQE